jgi:hypothetical protein
MGLAPTQATCCGCTTAVPRGLSPAVVPPPPPPAPPSPTVVATEPSNASSICGCGAAGAAPPCTAAAAAALAAAACFCRALPRVARDKGSVPLVLTVPRTCDTKHACSSSSSCAGACCQLGLAHSVQLPFVCWMRWNTTVLRLCLLEAKQQLPNACTGTPGHAALLPPVRALSPPVCPT